MALFVQSAPPLQIEFAPAVEITCNGLGRIEFLGGGMGCFVLYRNTIVPAEPVAGLPGRQVCGRVFAPLEAMTEALELMAAGLIEAGLARTATIGRRLLM